MKKTTTDGRLRRQQRSMYRQIGFRCLGSECNAFIVWKEVGPGHSAPTVRALKRASGSCPACGIRYQFSAEKLMEIQSEKSRRKVSLAPRAMGRGWRSIQSLNGGQDL